MSHSLILLLIKKVKIPILPSLQGSKNTRSGLFNFWAVGNQTDLRPHSAWATRSFWGPPCQVDIWLPSPPLIAYIPTLLLMICVAQAARMCSPTAECRAWVVQTPPWPPFHCITLPQGGGQKAEVRREKGEPRAHSHYSNYSSWSNEGSGSQAVC